MILVARDTEGLRLVLEQVLERDHDLFRLEPKLKGKTPEQQAIFLNSITKVTYSPGYERWARHLMYLEWTHQLGLPLGELLATEVEGMKILAEMRSKHRQKHPHCHSCGMPQHNRFQVECADCGAKFRRRGR